MEGGERESSSSSSSSLWPPRRTASFPSSSSGIRPWLLILLSAIIIILFLPSVLSSSSSLRTRGFIKNGWDALNLLLVLFAVLCGVFAPRTPPAAGDEPPVRRIENPTAQIHRMRSSSSYPDLRQDHRWGPADEWRFFDDFQLYRRRRGQLTMDPDSEIKTIPVDTYEIADPRRSRSQAEKSEAEKQRAPESAVVEPNPPPPPPPPPPKSRIVRKTPKRDRAEKSEPEEQQPPIPAVVKARPPPPPPPPVREVKRKQGKGAKDIAGALALFYQKNRKKGSSKSKRIHEEGNVSPEISASHSIPPPPPPPPPISFNKLFSTMKGGSKIKRTISASPPLPPPPPSQRSRRLPPPPSPPPPPPPPPSPPPQPPPPPPPPPPAAAAFCPSPDVNNKADMFIARFRAGLTLEKLNSIREKQQRADDEDEGELMMIGDLFD